MPGHKRQRLLESQLAFSEFLFVDLKRASSVQYISQELGMRRSGKLLGFGEILLRFGELLSLSVGDPLHHCFAHGDICGSKRGRKRFSQDPKGLLIVGLVKEDLCFQYFEAPSPFQVPACEARQGTVDVIERFVGVIMAQSPKDPIVNCVKMGR